MFNSKTFLLLAIAVLGIGALLLYSRDKRAETDRSPIGMTAEPCAESGLPVTENSAHDFAGLCVYAAANRDAASRARPPEIVLIGDSITQHWAEHDPDLFGPATLNRGISGQNSQQVLLRFGQDVAALRPRMVHVLVGTNDIAGNAGPTSPEAYAANIRAIADLAEANGVTLVLGTIPPASRFAWRPKQSPEPWIGQLNDRIRQFGRQRGIVVADYHAALARSDGSPRKALFRDGAHPNAAGYAAMKAVLERALSEARGLSPSAGAAPGGGDS
jgi:lysophospholipase L1-like esterase